MDNEIALCVVCAWRKNCQKKFFRNRDASFKCPDFTKDISIKNGVKSDDKKQNSGDNT